MNKIYVSKNELITNVVFFQYIYFTFVANYTIYSDLAILLFLALSGCLCIVTKKYIFSIYFFIDFIFILYSFLQIKLGISVYESIAWIKLNTLIKCFVINLATFNFIVIIDNVQRILKIYVYAILFGVITFFFVGWRTLLEGRFLQYTSIRFLGAEADVHSNGVGIVAAFAFIFTIYLFYHNKRKCFGIGSILMICIFLTGSRKSIILAAVGFFFILMYLNPDKKIRKIVLTLIGLLFSYEILMNVPFLYEIAGSRIENTIEYLLTGKTREASMSTRNWLIKVGIEYFRSRPITGFGLDNYRVIANNYNLYSHNNFVEILFSSGIVGFCIYYSKYILLLGQQLFNKLKKNISYDITSKILLSLFVILTIFEYWFVTYYERSIIIIHIFILSFLRISKNNNQNMKEHLVKEELS